LKPQPIFRFFVTLDEVHRHHQEVRNQFRALGLEKWCSAIQNVLKPRSSMHLA